MCAITRNGQFVAECARVERCFHVNLLRRGRRLVGDSGEDTNWFCEEDMVVSEEMSCYCMLPYQFCVGMSRLDVGDIGS